MLRGKLAVDLLCCLVGSSSPHAAERMCDVAKPVERPAGAPRASDVIMRSLSLHPRNADDPHDTMQALRDFHVSTLACGSQDLRDSLRVVTVPILPPVWHLAQ